jgi:HEAT repeat protein
MARKNQRLATLLLFALILGGGAYLWQNQSTRDSVGQLLNQFESGSETERAEAVTRLVALKDQAARIAPALAEFLKSPDKEVRTEAAKGLKDMGPDAKDAAGALTSALNEEGEQDSDFLSAILAALSKIGATPETEKSIPKIAELTEDDDPLVRLEASGALAAIGKHSKAALPHLLKAINNRTFPADIRNQVADTLVALGNRHPDTADQIREAVAKLDSMDGSLKTRVLKGLKRGDVDRLED